ncbi:hypothetical protein HaLaN_24809 [Haematococcus lacustris]|uniref:Uncharacterized protein n=1 Tax=Haematococcus lacustris TaxID=44745 RepID=A0A699ZVX4_HAELA|nr:hypothetical protein HaLaN_24809 [Haematococcus lacustris]
MMRDAAGQRWGAAGGSWREGGGGRQSPTPPAPPTRWLATLYPLEAGLELLEAALTDPAAAAAARTKFDQARTQQLLLACAGGHTKEVMVRGHAPASNTNQHILTLTPLIQMPHP